MADLDASNAQDVPDLANLKWSHPNDRRRIAACLVNIVYQLEKGNEKEQKVNEWCKPLQFEVYEKIKEEEKGKEVIFGAIFKWVGQSRGVRVAEELKAPLEVAAFRGTIKILGPDFRSNWNAMYSRHGSNTRVDIGVQSLQESIKRVGAHNILIAGHSMGAAIAIAAARRIRGKERDKMEAHLFNPPFLSPRLPDIEIFRKVGTALAAARDFWRSHGLVAPNALDFRMIKDEILRGLYNDFIGLRGWIPNLYVNRNDPICCSYIRYFEVLHGIYEQGSNIEDLYERMKYLFCFEIAQDRTPWHLIPSANLFVRDTNNHRLDQWWSRNLELEGKKYVPPDEASLPRT